MLLTETWWKPNRIFCWKLETSICSKFKFSMLFSSGKTISSESASSVSHCSRNYKSGKIEWKIEPHYNCGTISRGRPWKMCSAVRAGQQFMQGLLARMSLQNQNENFLGFSIKFRLALLQILIRILDKYACYACFWVSMNNGPFVQNTSKDRFWNASPMPKSRSIDKELTDERAHHQQRHADWQGGRHADEPWH